MVSNDFEYVQKTESSSFAASAWVGGAIAKAGAGFFVLATPAGWAGFIVVAAASSMAMNYVVKERSNGWYNDIMDWVDSL